MRNLSLSGGFALAAALLCSLPTLARCNCQLRLAVTNSSVIGFKGTSTSPVKQPITLDGPPALSLNGNVDLQLPAACPSNASSLLAGIQSSTLQAQSRNQLTLLPTDLTGKVRPSTCPLTTSCSPQLPDCPLPCGMGAKRRVEASWLWLCR